MSGFNKFLSGGVSTDLSDGTAIINAASLTSITLNADLPCATDSSSIIQTRLLDINDMQLVAGNPAITNHEMADFNITNVKQTLYKSSNDVNTANVVYTGTSNVTVDLDNLTGSGITWVGGASTIDNLLSISSNTDPPVAKDAGILSSNVVLSTTGSNDNRIVRFDGSGGKLIQNSNLILADNDDISIGADLYIHKPNSTSQCVGLESGEMMGALDANNTCYGRDSGKTFESNNNTAIGFNALSAACLNSNTAVGSGALALSRSTGNCALGFGAGGNVTTGTGIFIGFNAGSGQTTAGGTVVIGASSLLAANGPANTVIGAGIGNSITSGNNNIIMGSSAGSAYNSSATGNICIANAGASENNTTRLGSSQTSCFIAGIANQTPGGTPVLVSMDATTGELGTVSQEAARVVTQNAGGTNDNRLARYDGATGFLVQNSILGCDDNGSLTKSGSLYLSELGTSNNLALGSTAGDSIIAGASNNTALGQNAMTAMTDGDNNTGVGFNSLAACTGGANTALGQNCMASLTTGGANIAIGSSAASNYLSTEDNNIVIGSSGTTSDSGVIRLGSALQTTCFIDAIDGSVIPTGRTFAVVIDSNNQLVSSATHSPAGYVHGAVQTWTSITAITFGTASTITTLRAFDNSVDISWVGLKTMTITTSGVGGLSATYTEAANQSYDVYAVYDTTGVETTDVLAIVEDDLITTVLEFTSGDYDKFRKVGWFRNQSSDIIEHEVYGDDRSRNFTYRASRTVTQVLDSGSAVSWTDVADGGFGIESFTAPNTSIVICRLAMGDTSTTLPSNAEVAFRPNGSTLAATASHYTHSVGDGMGTGDLADTQIVFNLNKTDRIMEYENTTAFDVWLYVTSFNFGLP